jgi:hypothetical protein
MAIDLPRVTFDMQRSVADHTDVFHGEAR